MKISSHIEYLKYSYIYNFNSNIDNFINYIDDNIGDSYRINTKLFSENYTREILKVFELNKYSDNYFGNIKNIKDEVLKYKKNYKLIQKIEIQYNFKIDVGENDNFLIEIILGKDIQTIYILKVTILDVSRSVNGIHLVINKCLFKNGILINNNIGDLIFNNCILNTTIEFNVRNSGKLNTNNKYSGILNFINTSFDELIFENFTIGELKIEFDNSYINDGYDNNIIFIKGNIIKLKIYGENLDNIPKIGSLSFLHFKFNEDSEIFINHLNIDKLEFKSATNLTNSFKITNVKVEKEFNLEDVDFGKVIFNGLNLFNSKLNFKHPTFNNCIFNNVIWNEDCIILNSSNEELRDIYRQMKFIMDKLGDSIIGSKFYKNEMITQRELIKDSNFSERFVFLFGYYVSNFGQNWFRPLLILFILNFIFWNLNYHYIFRNNYSVSLDMFTTGYWNNFYYNLTTYIAYLTPFRKLTENPSIWDLLARITSTILIYQSAIAMRRKIER